MGLPKSKRSGGPRSPSGKQVSSTNALKTGTYSAMVILPGENESDFRQLEEQLVRDFSPNDAAELILVHDLAVITWKKLRLSRLEHHVMVHELNKPVSWGELDKEGVAIPYEARHFLNDLSLFTDTFIKQNRKHLEFLKKFEEYTISKDDFYQLPSLHPELYETIVDLGRERFQFTEPKPTPEQIALLNFKDDAHRHHSFVHHIFPILREQCELAYEVGNKINEIRAAIANIKERWLLNMMQQPTMMRASEDLSRALARTLNELRRQQQWRFKMRMSLASEVSSEKP